MKIIKELQEFALKGSFVDMAIGIVIGGAFKSIVDSLVSDIINPLIGLLTRGVDLTDIFIVLKYGAHKVKYYTLAEATTDGAVTLNIGQLCENVISFLIIAVVLFYVIKTINKFRISSKAIIEPKITTKNCPYCFSTINLKASICPNCTSAIDE